MRDQCVTVVSRVVRVASGVFAPGHVGELTRFVPFELVDAVLEQTGAGQRRVRRLPARVVVYLLLAAALFEGVGFGGVWRKLTAGLDGVVQYRPSGAALWQARSRLGSAPLKALFDLVRGPIATVATASVRWRGLLPVAIDGTMLAVPDQPRNTGRFTKHSAGSASSPCTAGYPQIRLVALVACGTRGIIDAVFGPGSTGETGYATVLLPSLRAGMILVGDRNFGISNALLAGVRATGADFLIRLKSNRRCPVLARYPDGSFLSLLAGAQVRIIECAITITTPAGTRTGIYRLATTLTDHHHYPAGELISLYHQRWEIETTYLELKHSLLGGRVLRSTCPALIDQEIYALLTTYQILRTAITDATDTHPTTNPTHASFTIALNRARDTLTQASGVITDTHTDLAGTIGPHVLANLLPHRPTRTRPRTVKRPQSPYHRRHKPNTDRTTYPATITIHTTPHP